MSMIDGGRSGDLAGIGAAWIGRASDDDTVEPPRPASGTAASSEDAPKVPDHGNQGPEPEEFFGAETEHGGLGAPRATAAVSVLEWQHAVRIGPLAIAAFPAEAAFEALRPAKLPQVATAETAGGLAAAGAIQHVVTSWGIPVVTGEALEVATHAGEIAPDAPQDEPLYGEMWHLAMLGDIGSVWADYDGTGVHVAVYDDGVEYAHPDLDDNYDAASHILWNGVPLDPAPTNSDEAKHGTAVSGVIAAEDNGLGTVGIAYGATVTGVNILSGPANINGEGDQLAAFEHAIGRARDFDIVNNSWGSFPVYLSDMFDVIIAAGAAFRTAAEIGRGGLGTLIVKAAGNASDSAQGDALDPSRFTVTVSAYDWDGDASWYTSRGANVLVAAPSSGHTVADADGNILPAGDLRIATTDRLGAEGYGPGDWSSALDTSGFGGTSSSTPTVSGIIALMLEANPNLGWRDVQDILAYSARHIGGQMGVHNTATEVVPRDADFDGVFETTAPQLIEFDTWKWNAANDWNGGGLHQSNDYGMGAVHVHDAVRMAEVWSRLTPAGPSTSGNEITVSSGRYENPRRGLDALFHPQTPGAIVDDALENSWIGRDGDPLSFSYDVTVSGTSMTLDYVDMFLEFNTVALADLRVMVTSPGGTQITLLDEDYNDYAPEFTTRVYLSWTFGAHAFKGEDPNGIWTIDVTEFRLGNTVEGTDFLGNPTSILADGNRVTGVELIFHGDAGSASSTAGADTWTYTDEVFFALAEQPGRLNLTDDGGTDWFNAAAMTGDVVLDLGPLGGASVGGAAFAAFTAGTAIENAVTGDGNDDISGSDDANTLMGMRGDDTLDGRGGSDLLVGGRGADLIYGGDGIDTASYENSGKGISLSLGGTPGLGGDAAGDLLFGVENLLGSGFNDVLLGDGASNTIHGGAGGDVISGGGGSDVLYGGNGFDVLSGADGGAGEADTLYGGAQTDIAYYFNATSALEIDLSDHTDPLANSGEHTLDTWVSIEGVYGANAHSNTLTGDSGDNLFLGGNQADTLYGREGADILTARGGDDVLYGGSGNDYISGDAGNDDLYGGAGRDTFYVLATSEIDRIRDFSTADDSLLFYKTGATQWSELTRTQVGADVEITVSGGSFTVIVENVQVADLDGAAGGFSFL